MIQVYDNIFDKIFLLEEARWLLERCNWRVDNVAHRYTKPYGIEGEHRLMGTTIYNNFRGSAERYWEHIYKKDRKNGCTELEQFVGMYKTIQSVSKNKCMLQAIEGNLQFQGMPGSFHKDGNENQIAFIMMIAYHDIQENMGGEFFHEPSGERIPFKQGRIIEFGANDTHRADPFNVPNIPRFSIKWIGLSDEKTRIYMGDDTSFSQPQKESIGWTSSFE